MARANSDPARAGHRSAPGHRSRRRSIRRKRAERSRKKSRKPRLHKIPHAVERAIAGETLRLYRACTLLTCLRYAADYAEDQKEFCTANMAETIYELVDRAIRGLDIVRLSRAGLDGEDGDE